MNKLIVKDIYGNGNYQKCKKSDLIFDFEDDTEIFCTDWQLGHEDVKTEALKRLATWTFEKPHRYIILQDFLDDQWLSKFAHLSYGSNEEEEELKQLNIQLEILKPIYHRFIFQIGSNHWMRRFGLHLSPERSQRARTQFNIIYGKIYEANSNFKQYYSTECIVNFKFRSLPNLKMAFIHPSRLGSASTVINRATNYYGCYGLVVGHTHDNIDKTIQSAIGNKLHVWFSSHLFKDQPEYEKERMATFSSSEPLILGWHKNVLTGDTEFGNENISSS